MNQVSSEMICEYLRRKLRDKVLNAAAKEIGVTHAYLYPVVRNGVNRNFSIDVINKFARYFGVTTEEFLRMVRNEIG